MLAKRSIRWLESLDIILVDMMERIVLVDPIEHVRDNHGVISRNRWNASYVPRFMPWGKCHAWPGANLVMPANARIISKTLTFLLPHLYPLLCGVDVSYETPPFSKKNSERCPKSKRNVHGVHEFGYSDTDSSSCVSIRTVTTADVCTIKSS